MNIGTRYKLKQCLTGWHPQDRKNTWLEIYLPLDEKRYCKTTSTDMDEYKHSISRLGRFKIFYRWMNHKRLFKD